MQQSIVFDIGGTQSRIALVEDRRIVWRDQQTTPAHAGPDATVALVARMLAPLASVAAPVCVAITGQIADGCVTAHNAGIMSGWHMFPLRQCLEAALGRPVRLVNDARAAAWGEYLYGAGQGCDEFMFMTVSTGVGAGLVLNRRLHRATNGFDAELGETRCAGGLTLEQHASGSALNAVASRLGFQDARGLCDAAEAGDSRALEIYHAGIALVAGKLADLAVMLGIQRVAVGGSVGLRPGYIARLRAALQAYPPIYQVDLVASQLGQDAGIYGAAEMAHSG